MKTYNVKVIRKQSWDFTVEAEDAEAAKQAADDMANNEPAHDDWAYDTEAHEV